VNPVLRQFIAALARHPQPAPVDDRLADDNEALQADLGAAHARIADLEESVAVLHAANQRLQAALNDKQPDAVDGVDPLLARIRALQADNDRLMSGRVGEQLLRERDTNRRLAAEVDRLTQASLAAEKEGW
jgi:uncharacterized small protein (DUF1192 family)